MAPNNMVNPLFLLIICDLSGIMSVLKPLGVKLCEELCVSYGQCHSPLYVEQQLECYLTDTDTVSTKLAIKLTAPKRDVVKVFSRLIFSRAGKLVTIKSRNICKGPNLTHIIPESYTNVRIGKRSIKIKGHRKKMTWPEARKVCQTEGGDLVKVDSTQKNRTIRRYIKKVLGERHVWIGLADMAGNNTYVWTDGSPLVFSHWGPVEPSYNINGQDEDCVRIDIFEKTFFTVLVWNDAICVRLHSFICEKKNL